MNFEELHSYLNKRGFFNTFQVLSKFKHYKAEKGEFYKLLTEFSHYNSFLRIKDKLIGLNLIRIENDNGKEFIELTEKGISLYDNLILLNKFFKEED
ncbi:MAG: hypothetical protein ACFFEY_01505 [Candidatus Thorarchaeota archaeon]